MQEKQTIKRFIKATLQLLSIGLLVALLSLVTYGYLIARPALDKKALEDGKKITLNLTKSFEQALMDAKDNQPIVKDEHQEVSENNAPNADNIVAPHSVPEATAPNPQVKPEDKPLEAAIPAESHNANPTGSNDQELNKVTPATTEPTPSPTVAIPSSTTPAPTAIVSDENKTIAVNQGAEQDAALSSKALNDPVPSQQPNNYNVRKAKIAILLTNLGLGKNVTEFAMQLPKEIAFGFSPYTNSLKILMSKAKDTGHEIFIELPLETDKYPLDDVGPLGILTSLDKGENSSRLQSILLAFPNINGVYSLPNERFTDNLVSVEPILDILARHRLLLLYGKSTPNISLTQLVSQKKIPIVSCDIYIDLSTEYDQIKQKLEKLEEISRSKGIALGYINSYPITMNALLDWIKNLNYNEVELVLVSEALSN